MNICTGISTPAKERRVSEGGDVVLHTGEDDARGESLAVQAEVERVHQGQDQKSDEDQGERGNEEPPGPGLLPFVEAVPPRRSRSGRWLVGRRWRVDGCGVRHPRTPLSDARPGFICASG